MRYFIIFLLAFACSNTTSTDADVDAAVSDSDVVDAQSDVTEDVVDVEEVADAEVADDTE